MGKPFTPERLANTRRMRRVRRLYRQQPLFAYEMLCREYVGYSYGQFLDDLRYRTKPKRKEKKTTLTRYGRYRRMAELLERYRQTGELEFALQAQRLRKRMTKPYRVLVKISGESIEYGFEPTIAITEIERLTSDLKTCKSEKDADEMIAEFRKHSRIG